MRTAFGIIAGIYLWNDVHASSESQLDLSVVGHDSRHVFKYRWADMSSRDRRPTLLGRFPNRDVSTLYSFIIDTGTSVSLIRSHHKHRRESPQSVPGLRMVESVEGFNIGVNDQLIEDDGELAFGEEHSERRIADTGKVLVNLEFVDDRTGSRFDFDTSIYLTQEEHQYPTSGIIAASRASDFSRRTSKFVLIPEKGEIVLGDSNESDYSDKFCGSAPFFHADLEPSTEHDFWTIRGGVRVGQGESHDVEWTIDTGAGADGTQYIPESAYTELLELIERTGATVSEHEPGYKRAIHNCNEETQALFPTISISVFNKHGEVMSVDIGPKEYIQRMPPYYDSVCFLNVVPSRNQWSSSTNAYLLGLGFLDRMVTIFDNEAEQISFCTICIA